MHPTEIRVAWVVGSLLGWWCGVLLIGFVADVPSMGDWSFGAYAIFSVLGTFACPAIAAWLAFTGRLPGTGQSEMFGRPRAAPRYSWIIATIAATLGLYAIACVLPVARVGTGGGRFLGHNVSEYDDVWGVLALLFGFKVIPWWANPFWLIGLIVFCCRQYRIAAVLALVALVLASTAWLPPRAPGFYLNKIARLYVGAYFWWASVAVLAVGSFLLFWNDKRKS